MQEIEGEEEEGDEKEGPTTPTRKRRKQEELGICWPISSSCILSIART